MRAPTLIPASYLILTRENEILLSQRRNTGHQDGNYSLPAGHVEKGETFTQCIIREAQEEINISLKEEDLKVVHVLSRKSFDTDDRIEIFFQSSKWESEVKNMEPEKCGDLAWFPLDQLPKNMTPWVRTAIQHFQKRVVFSEFDWK